jgi:hypothetical protein
MQPETAILVRNLPEHPAIKYLNYNQFIEIAALAHKLNRGVEPAAVKVSRRRS